MTHQDKTKEELLILIEELRKENSTLKAFHDDVTSAQKVSDEILNEIIENNPMSIQIIDKDGFTLRTNPAHTTLFGTVPPPDFSIFADLKNKGMGEYILRGLKGEVVHFPEIYYNTHDIFPELPDQPVCIRAILFPLNKKHSNLEQFVFMHENITERKKSEAALGESLSKLKTLVENIPQMVFMKDLDSKYVFVNENYARDLNLSTNDILGKSDADLFPYELAVNYIRHDLRVIETGQTDEIDEEYVVNGEKKWVHTTKVPNRDKDGKITGVFGIFRDITEQKQAKEELKKTNFLLSHAERVAKIGNWRLLLNSKEFTSSHGAKTIYGVENDSLLQENIQKIPLIQYRNILDKALDALINYDIPYDYNFKIYRKADGKILDIHSIAEYDKENNIVYGVIQDITDQKLVVEELVKAKEHAEESDRLKSAFLANMSHEIRTPMNGILGFTELLKDPDLTGEEQGRFIDIIQKGGVRLLNIINNLITISKVESGQMEMIYSETNINDQIDFLYSFFQPDAAQRGIRLIHTKALAGIDSVMNTDTEKVYAILTNLIKNALKFTIKGSVEFGYEVLESYNHSLLLQFFVKDTGTGISSEMKKTIFERFRKGSDFHTQNHDGAGLGLSISKAYIEMLGGKIWVESEPDEGATFYFTLPSRVVPN